MAPFAVVHCGTVPVTARSPDRAAGPDRISHRAARTRKNLSHPFHPAAADAHKTHGHRRCGTPCKGVDCSRVLLFPHALAGRATPPPNKRLKSRWCDGPEQITRCYGTLLDIGQRRWCDTPIDQHYGLSIYHVPSRRPCTWARSLALTRRCHVRWLHPVWRLYGER